MAKEEETRTEEDKLPRDEKTTAAAKAEDDHDDAEDEGGDESDEEDEGDENEEEVAAKPAEIPKSVPEEQKTARVTGAGRARPRPIRALPPPPTPAPNLGARVIVFVGILGVLSAGFWLLSGFDSGLDKPIISWRPGQLIDMDITLVKEDANNLACSSAQTVAGKKCEYATKTDKNADLTDATMLKPYTTADGVNFLAAGLWSQPALAKGKLPNERFTIHCKLKVEGQLKNPLIRWNPTAAWGEKKDDWWTGTATDCKMNPP